MALFDFLQGIARPVIDYGGRFGAELQKPETFQPLLEDVRAILPYAATLGMDNPQLPEIMIRLRTEREAKKLKLKEEEVVDTEKFFNKMGYAVNPNAAESLIKLKSSDPLMAPNQFLEKAIKSNYVVEIPPAKSEIRNITQEKEVNKYVDLAPEQLQSLYQKSGMTVAQLKAIREAANARGYELKSIQQLAEEAKKEAEKGEKVSLTEAIKEEMVKYDLDEDKVKLTASKQALRDYLVDKRAGRPVGTLKQIRTGVVVPGLPAKYQLEYIPATGKGATTVKEKDPDVQATITQAVSLGWSSARIKKELESLGINPADYGY